MKINSLLLLVSLSPILFPENGFSQANSARPLPEAFIKFTRSPFGSNVLVFEPGMEMKEVQSAIDTIFKRQSARRSEFTRNRYALLFKPGKYDLDIKVDYYMQVLGLGQSPGDVVINGAVRSNTTHGNSVLTNFWRSVENLTIIPSRDTVMVWGVSQAAPLRRVHIKGDLHLFDKGYASGGFLADSKVDGKITSGPQQQWFTRNSQFSSWEGGVWNMMFVGVPEAPAENWPEKPYTTILETPVIREKPWLSFEDNEYKINIPAISWNSSGPEWISNAKPAKKLPLSGFYVAMPDRDDAGSMNMALKKGKDLLITPGRYFLKESLKVTKPGTLVMGMGLATLIPENGNTVVEISDVNGVIVCGLTIDAGKVFSENLFVAGDKGTRKRHETDPVFLYDIFFRVGGPAEGSAHSCMVLNSNDVCIDHVWLWRADHGNGVGWDKNRCANGIIVNGTNVTVYGLFNEHFQEYQTLWNGENGRVYFYQSEMPYDPPAVDSWKHDNVYGYASYKVADNVKTHEAWGIGIYNVFYNAPVIVDNAIETPSNLENRIHHKIIFWLNGNKESVVRSIINGKGGPVNVSNRKATLE
ncbi:MAG: coagulation factor 5/8 type domain-containing protein [Bacteroidota bacterium]|nr:coagulation factor 5/8 type domain-containing protein [Bacteroidota bacterium]